MHARVVRFTDVTPERIEEIVARVEESDGPPPGVDAKGMELFLGRVAGNCGLRRLLRERGEAARGE